MPRVTYAFAQVVLEEGAVATLVSISKSPHDDPKVRRYCAQAFFYLSEKAKYRKQLVEQGAMAALLHLSNAIANATSKSRLLRCGSGFPDMGLGGHGRHSHRTARASLWGGGGAKEPHGNTLCLARSSPVSPFSPFARRSDGASPLCGLLV